MPLPEIPRSQRASKLTVVTFVMLTALFRLLLRKGIIAQSDLGDIRQGFVGDAAALDIFDIAVKPLADVGKKG